MLLRLLFAETLYLQIRHKIQEKRTEVLKPALRLISVDKVHWVLFAIEGTCASNCDLTVADKGLSISLIKYRAPIL